MSRTATAAARTPRRTTGAVTFVGVPFGPKSIAALRRLAAANDRSVSRQVKWITELFLKGN